MRARDWWLANRDKAPKAFDEELVRLRSALHASASHVGETMAGPRGLRRVLLKRIRYYVYFRVLERGAKVRILALWHASRGNEPAL